MIDHETVPVDTSPVGRTIGAARRRRAATDPEYGRAYDALTVARQVAYQVLEYRLDHGLTQQLAEMTGTSLPQISRIESGVHHPTLKTLQRPAEVMGKNVTVSFVDAVVDDTMVPAEAALPVVTQKTTQTRVRARLLRRIARCFSSRCAPVRDLMSICTSPVRHSIQTRTKRFLSNSRRPWQSTNRLPVAEHDIAPVSILGFHRALTRDRGTRWTRARAMAVVPS